VSKLVLKARTKKCSTCGFFKKGGKCTEAGEVIKAHSSDSLEEWTENPNSSNTCKIYRA